MTSADPALVEIRFTVERNYRRWRLDRYLQLKVKRLSRTRVARVIRRALLVNGRPVSKPGHRIQPGDEIVIRRVPPPEPDTPRTFDVIASAPSYVAIDKPAGLPIHPTARYFLNTLTTVIRERFGPDSGLQPTHRLDRETSGIVLLGRGRDPSRLLKEAFRTGDIRKRYLAIVHGRLTSPQQIDLPIGSAEGSRIRIKMGVRSGGRPATTEVAPLGFFRDAGGRDYSLVEAQPLSGRTHQIRVHLTAIGHPLLGDKIYGQPDEVFLRFLEQAHGELNEWLLDRLQLPRQALHAAALDFPDPSAPGARCVVRSPLPPDLTRFLATLKETRPNLTGRDRGRNRTSSGERCRPP